MCLLNEWCFYSEVELGKKFCYFYIILRDYNELVKTFYECWITKGDVQFPFKDNLCQHIEEEFNQKATKKCTPFSKSGIAK